MYEPSVVLAVNSDVAARPFSFVAAIIVFVPVDVNVPLAPLDGAVKVTSTPLTGRLFSSNTNTVKGDGKFEVMDAA